MRYFLIDRILSLQPPEVATAVKCVSLSDDVFVDHFPSYPIFPGALVIEALAQTGGVLIEATMRERGRHDLHAVLTIVEKAKFRRQVRPGDRLELEARGLRVTEDGGQVRGVARLDGEVAAEVVLGFAFTTITSPKQLARRREVLDIWLRGTSED